MKKLMIIAIVAMAAIFAQAATYETITLAAVGGTTYTSTNLQSVGQTVYTDAYITYDAANQTNAITFYAKIGGIRYLLGLSSVTNGQYDHVTLSSLGIRSGDALIITTTQTNANIRLAK